MHPCQRHVEAAMVGFSAFSEVLLLLGANRLVLFHHTIFRRFKEHLTIASLIASKHYFAWLFPQTGFEGRMSRNYVSEF